MSALSLCSRLRTVSYTPKLACLCTLFGPGPTRKNSQHGPRCMFTLRVAGAPGWWLGQRGGGGGLA